MMRHDVNTNQTRPSAARTNRQRRPTSGAPRPQVRNTDSARRNYERYIELARASALAGDTIEAENCYQYAEHYFRTMNADAS